MYYVYETITDNKTAKSVSMGIFELGFVAVMISLQGYVIKIQSNNTYR